MAVKEIASGVYAIPLGIVNAFLLDADGVTIIDTGVAGSADKILEAIREIGRTPADVRHILVTHCHGDHSGSLAALRRVVDAPSYMHPLDAALVREGRAVRHLKPVPDLYHRILYRIFVHPPLTIEPFDVEREVNDGDELPIAGGIQAIHVPGHCAGQLAFLWPRNGGVLFAADAAGNIPRLGLSLGYEDLEEGKRSLAKLASFSFEVACFGHGGAITRGASSQFKKKWEARASRAPVKV